MGRDRERKEETNDWSLRSPGTGLLSSPRGWKQCCPSGMCQLGSSQGIIEHSK